METFRKGSEWVFIYDPCSAQDSDLGFRGSRSLGGHGWERSGSMRWWQLMHDDEAPWRPGAGAATDRHRFRIGRGWCGGTGGIHPDAPRGCMIRCCEVGSSAEGTSGCPENAHQPRSCHCNVLLANDLCLVTRGRSRFGYNRFCADPHPGAIPVHDNGPQRTMRVISRRLSPQRCAPGQPCCARGGGGHHRPSEAGTAARWTVVMPCSPRPRRWYRPTHSDSPVQSASPRPSCANDQIHDAVERPGSLANWTRPIGTGFAPFAPVASTARASGALAIEAPRQAPRACRRAASSAATRSPEMSPTSLRVESGGGHQRCEPIDMQ